METKRAKYPFDEQMIQAQQRKIRTDKAVIGSGKFLYSDIVNHANNEDGFCNLRNRHFSKEYNVHMDTISRWLTSLEKAGYIERETIRDQETKEITERRIYILEPKEM